MLPDGFSMPHVYRDGASITKHIHYTREIFSPSNFAKLHGETQSLIFSVCFYVHQLVYLLDNAGRLWEYCFEIFL